MTAPATVEAVSVTTTSGDGVAPASTPTAAVHPGRIQDAGEKEVVARSEQAHDHGRGDHAAISIDAMTRDMRDRFLVVLALAVPIGLWSPLGERLLGLRLPTPFGIGVDWW